MKSLQAATFQLDRATQSGLTTNGSSLTIDNRRPVEVTDPSKSRKHAVLSPSLVVKYASPVFGSYTRLPPDG